MWFGDTSVPEDELAISRGLLLSLEKRRLVAGSGAWTEVDGYSEEPPVLVEAWAHQGPPKPAQKAKVIADALRLVWIERAFMPGARKILLFSDAAAGRHFIEGKTWAASAIAWSVTSWPSKIARAMSRRSKTRRSVTR